MLRVNVCSLLSSSIWCWQSTCKLAKMLESVPADRLHHFSTPNLTGCCSAKSAGNMQHGWWTGLLFTSTRCHSSCVPSHHYHSRVPLRLHSPRVFFSLSWQRVLLQTMAPGNVHPSHSVFVCATESSAIQNLFIYTQAILSARVFPMIVNKGQFKPQNRSWTPLNTCTFLNASLLPKEKEMNSNHS